jgi:hypothetical protein
MGGGGDNGYQAKQDQIEGSKQKARAAINAMFGMSGPDGLSALVGDAPTRDQFTTLDQSDEVSKIFNEQGFNAAQQDYNARAAQGQQALANVGNRDGLYQSVRDNAYTAGKRKLDEQQQEAARKLKFELFATGQAGGSGDIDENAKQKRIYDQGLIDLGAKADAAKADFHNADEDTRMQLLQSVDNGMDQGSALSQAAQRMQIASDKAAADANGTAVGDLFDTGSMLYNQSQYAKGRQAGQTASFNMFPQQQMGLSSKAGTKTGTVINNSAYGG